MLENEELKSETGSYYNFVKIILVGILQYEESRIKHNEDNVEFQAVDENGEKILCIEAKGSDTDLYRYQSYGKADKKTAILQTWSYMGMDGRKYGICTNYNKFVLMTKAGGYERQHVFDFDSIREHPDRLKEFILIFSMRTLIDGENAKKLRQESENEQRDFTEKFYNLFHETRVILINNFRNNKSIGREQSIYYAQIMLNRLMFIFFVADRGLLANKNLFMDKITSVIKQSNFTEYSHKIYDEINGLFTVFDKGSNIDRVSKFNGSLFSGQFPANVQFLDIDDKTKIQTDTKLPNPNEKIERIQRSHPNLNPIITNMLIMDQYDFNTEVDVSILGHIFEQSLSDIEVLKKIDGDDIDIASDNVNEKKTKNIAIENRRKHSGVYYTPEYITEYICKNTIVPYLSKSGTNSIQELMMEYDDDYNTLEKKIKNIRILDPACGSGAFLIQAVDVLMNISRAMYERQSANTTQQTLDDVWEETTIRRIITENIYGVDLNRESVDITKLSLFLKMVTNNNSLIDLSDNIKAGNSVISDTNEPNAFDWKKNFPDILKSHGGFDVIIGNPPYVRQEELDYKDSIQLPPINTLRGSLRMDKKMDLSGYFYYHSLNILKVDGILGFISSDSWLHVGYGAYMRELFLTNCNISKIIKYEFNVFDDADIVTATVILKKVTKSDNKTKLCRAASKEDTLECNFICEILSQASLDMDKNWNGYFPQTHFEPSVEMVKMKNAGKVRFGKKTGYNKFFLLTQEIIDKYNIVDKYKVPVVSKDTPEGYLGGMQITEYLLNVNVEKGELLKNTDGRNVLEYIKTGEPSDEDLDESDDKVVVSAMSSIASRKLWYSLNLQDPASIFLGRFADKQMKMYENDGRFYARDNFVLFTPHSEEHKHAFLAYFVSSWFSLHLEKNGHAMGGGALYMQTINYKEAPVPDFTKIPQKTIDELKNAWLKYRDDFKRDELDEVVFSALGFTPEQGEEIKHELELHIKRRTSR